MIELQEEWEAPWEITAAVYVYKMENTADGDVERVSVNLTGRPGSAHSGSSVSDTSCPAEPLEEPSHLVSPSASSEADEEGSGVMAGRRRAEAEIEVGDLVQLSSAGEASYLQAMRCMRMSGHELPNCLAPGSVAEVLEANPSPGSPGGDRFRVRICSTGAVFWYPRAAIAPELLPNASEEAAPDARWAVSRDEAKGSAGVLADWDYTIAFQIPWVLRKVFAVQVLKLKTDVVFNAKERELVTVMRNEPVMGITLSEETTFSANVAGGTTWRRKLTVSYPDWLPGWAEKKVKKLYRAETATATRAFRIMFSDMQKCATQILASVGTKSVVGYSPITADFLDQLGLTGSLANQSMIHRCMEQQV